MATVLAGIGDGCGHRKLQSAMKSVLRLTVVISRHQRTSLLDTSYPALTLTPRVRRKKNNGANRPQFYGNSTEETSQMKIHRVVEEKEGAGKRGAIWSSTSMSRLLPWM